ncbi:MAG TPA: radical SAM protein [Candidatus Hodarchaeales archaeon]|nr:radical SAM protein [Candidatus Hodarchaeales archaeon]
MKILLIRPPYDRLKKTAYGPYFPLGLGYLATSLHDNGFEVRIYNADNASDKAEYLESGSPFSYRKRMGGLNLYQEELHDNQHPVWAEIEAALKSFQPDLVGLTALSVAIGTTSKVSRMCKEHNPNCHIVWGGPHVTVLPDNVLSNPDVDFAIRGEGEYSLLELCQTLARGGKDFSAIDGLSYRKNKQIVHNKPRAMIEDLNQIPFPARHLVLFPENYDSPSWGHILGVRGCPYKCTFCSARALWGKPRYRSAENIIGEIKQVMTRFKSRDFWLEDDTLTSNRKRALDLCQRIIDLKPKINWRGLTRVDCLDDELLDAMKKAGCSSVLLGIESGSDRILKLLKKGTTVEEIKRATRLLDKHKLDYAVFFMGGFPQETKEDLLQTLDLMKRIHPIRINFNVFTPLPGSELYDEIRAGSSMSEDAGWEDLAYCRDGRYYTENISDQEFERMKNDILDHVDSYNNSWGVRLRRMIHGKLRLKKRRVIGMVSAKFAKKAPSPFAAHKK